MIRCWGNDGEEGGKGVQWRRSRRRRVQRLTEKSQYCSSGIIEARKVQGNARSGLFIGTSCSYGVPGVCGHCVYLFLRGNGGPRHPGVKSTFPEDIGSTSNTTLPTWGVSPWQKPHRQPGRTSRSVFSAPSRLPAGRRSLVMPPPQSEDWSEACLSDQGSQDV